MILPTYISGAYNFICSGFWLILDLSSFIGQNLVYQILAILRFTSRLLELILTIIRVIYKDAVFFFQDLTEDFSCFLSFVVENLFNFRDGMTSFSSTLIHGAKTLPKLFYELLNSLSLCLSGLADFIKAILTLLWDGFLLIGSSFWLVVMNAPLGILYCIKKFFEQLQYFIFSVLGFFGTVTTSVLNGVQSVFNFICNIPYSSVLGSVLTIILFYVFLKNFNKLCILSFKISVAFCKYLSSLLYSVCMGHFFGRNSQRHNHDFNRLIEDKLCVICQDKFKEVIVMPCRHLCLCVNCKRLIVKNQRVCPICRTNIEAMMEVYM